MTRTSEIHVGWIVAMQFFTPNLHQTIKGTSTVLVILLRCPRMVGRSLFSGNKKGMKWNMISFWPMLDQVRSFKIGVKFEYIGASTDSMAGK